MIQNIPLLIMYYFSMLTNCHCQNNHLQLKTIYNWYIIKINILVKTYVLIFQKMNKIRNCTLSIQDHCVQSWVFCIHQYMVSLHHSCILTEGVSGLRCVLDTTPTKSELLPNLLLAIEPDIILISSLERKTE